MCKLKNQIISMVLRWIVKIFFAVAAILCSVVVGIMYTKLSFIDWPYVIGSALSLGLALFIPLKKRI
jgi:hypothetical protein